MKKIFLLLLLSIFFVQKSWSQISKEFWFAAPEVSLTAPYTLDRPIQLVLTTLNAPANVTISIPARNGVIPINVTIPALSTNVLDITDWVDSLENIIPDQVLNNGLHILSDANITAYYNVESGGPIGQGNNPELFTLKGSNALGTHFVIPGQNLLDNATIAVYNPIPYNSFDIVATENNTVVTITPRRDIVGHLASAGSFNIILNKGQTYSARAISANANDHLQGSFVSSNKPIAITVKDDNLYAGPFQSNCADLVGDQILPINMLGKEYIAIRTYLNAPFDQLFITATVNNTHIYVDGSAVASATINAGETYNLAMNAESVHIIASEPVAVWQIAGSGCEFGAAILPQIKCTGSKRISYVRISSYQLKMNLLVRAGHQQNFTINNIPLTNATFSYVPGTNNQWMYCRYDLSSSQYPRLGVINVSNSTSEFHMSVIDITSGGTSYGYYSNYGNVSRINFDAPTHFCKGENINYQVDNPNNINFLWTGPNNFTANSSALSIPNAQPHHSGWYKFSANDFECLVMDSVYIEVRNSAAIKIVADTIGCQGEIINARVNSSTRNYEWLSPNNRVLKNDGSIDFVLDQSKWIKIAINDTTTCTSHDSVYVQIEQPSNLILQASDTILGCNKDEVKLSATGAHGYIWKDANGQTLGTDSIINLRLNRGQYITVNGYSEKAKCLSQDSIFINYLEQSYYFVPNAFSPNADGLNDLFYPNIYCEFNLLEFSVYNRFGERVFYTMKLGDGWDGTFKDSNCDIGTYYWYIRGVNTTGEKVVYRGNVSLIR